MVDNKKDLFNEFDDFDDEFNVAADVVTPQQQAKGESDTASGQEQGNALLEKLWQRRMEGISFSTDRADYLEAIKPEEIQYLCNYKYPFLQVINPDADETVDAQALQFVRLPSQWILLDYGYAMSSSASTKLAFPLTQANQLVVNQNIPMPDFIKDGSTDGSSDDGGDSGDGGGTIIEQQFMTALAMLLEAQARGWGALEIVDGNNLMKFYAWLIATHFGLSVYGYEPSEEEIKHADFISAQSVVENATRKAYKSHQASLRRPKTSLQKE